MSIEASVLVSCSIAITALGLLIFFRNPIGPNNQRFALLSLSLVGWTVFNYLSDTTDVNSLLYTRLTFFCGIAAIFSLTRFIGFFPNEKALKSSNLLLFHILWTALLLPISLTPAFVSSVSSVPEPTINTSYLYPVFLLYILYSLILLFVIILKQRKYTRFIRQKQQLSIVAWGIVLYAFFAVMSSVILPLIVDSWSSSRIGPVFTLILVGMVAYTVVKHRLFDIRLVVARSIAYFLVLLVLGSVYILGIVALGGFLFDQQIAGSAQQFYDLALIIILAFSFHPLRHFFEKTTDNIFFRDSYDSQTLLSNLASVMSREIELERLSNGVLRELTSQMSVSKASLIVLDGEKVFFEGHTNPNNRKNITPEELKTIGRGVLIKDALEPSLVPDVFNEYGIDVSVELQSPHEFLGYLFIGAKRSGDIFNDNDIRNLRILANELAVAIHNAKSYTQIQNFNQTLQARIEEATAQLMEANANLKRLDGVKNEFISMATHQLNTPLTVVDGYLGMIGDGKHGDLEAQQRDFLEKSLHRIRLMKRMVYDFLNVSRMENNKFVIEISPTDLNKLVTEEINELAPAAKQKNVFLQFVTPKHPVPVVEIDQDKTRQAVMNLIDNALYYSPNGEVRVYLDSDEEQITFRVVDTGIGVPDSQKDQLFSRFFRADNAKKERPSGTGVGLYLVKRVVEDQGGKIIFKSQVGKGSTFGFSLPIKPIPKEEAAPEPSVEREKELVS